MVRQGYTTSGIIIALLLLACWTASARAADHFYAIAADSMVDGFVMYDGGMYGGCPSGDPGYSRDSTATLIEINVNYVGEPFDWEIKKRGIIRWHLTDVQGTVDSARIKLVLERKIFANLPTGIEFYYGFSCLSPGEPYCYSVGTPWDNCTDLLITIPADDLPEARDTLHLSVTAEQLGDVGSGKCFDMKMVATVEDSVCYATGTNTVTFFTTEADTLSYEPILYVWSHDEAAVRPARIMINETDIDLSNPPLIRREGE